MYMRPTYSDYGNIDPRGRIEPSEHQYLLFDSHMFGFVLKDREYGMHLPSCALSDKARREYLKLIG
jgi:hypothetical protein